MSKVSFVKGEEISQSPSVLPLTLRLIRSLPLLKRILPLCVVTIILACAGPAVFRWYIGKYAECTSQLECDLFTIPFIGIQFPVNIEGIAVLAFLAVAFRVMAWIFFEIGGLWSSQKIHKGMIQGLAKCRTTFFDEQPSGRLINRIMYDFNELRFTAVSGLGELFNSGTELLFTFGLALFVNPWAMVLAIPLFAVFFYIQFHRTPMINHATSLSSISKGRALDRLTDLIEGYTVYRLYDKGRHLLSRIRIETGKAAETKNLINDIENWSNMWSRVSGEMFSFIILLSLTYSLAQGKIGIPLAGVIISALFSISSNIRWVESNARLFTGALAPVSRVFEYVDLPSEDAQTSHGKNLGPVKGGIEFNNYSMSYRKDSPVVLNNISFNIPAGSKVGIIGRTGSGKSSVVQALFRMGHPQGGTIRIDGQSIDDFNVEQVRNVFGVVPQFPYLFLGTLRSNLDRSLVLADADMKRALDSVGLGYSLDFEIEEAGRNLSRGERQLVCLARVIVANKKVILMDEATSGLDSGSDAKINTVLKTALADKTVITIAHRQEALWNYDMVIEMDQGQVLRTGTPKDLLKN